MQSQIDFEQKRMRAGARERYEAFIADLSSRLSISGWVRLDMIDLLARHRVTRNLDSRLIRIGAIERSGKRGAFSYRAKPLLMKITAEELVARMNALVDDDTSETSVGESGESWLYWAIGGFAVGCVFGSLLMYLAQ